MLTAGAATLNYASFSSLEESIGLYRQNVAKRQVLLSKIKDEMGYDGGIHHFKNYVLRGQESNAIRALQHFEEIENLLLQYQSFDLSSQESHSLNVFSGVVKQYKQQLIWLEKQNYSPGMVANMDVKVRVDDSSALNAIHVLKTELIKRQKKRSALNDQILSSATQFVLFSGVVHIFSVFD